MNKPKGMEMFMEWLDSIKGLKKDKGWTNEELAEKSGISPGTLNKLLSGATAEPKLGTLESLAEVFACSMDRLLGRQSAEKAAPDFGEYADIFKKYTALDAAGREAADGIINKEYRRLTAARRGRIFSTDAGPVRELPLFDIAASAGTGAYISDVSSFELINIYANAITDKASFAVRIKGNSMEPVYHEGDIVLVEQSDRIAIGELGIFVINGESYFKKFGGDRLISLNPDYGEIPLGNSESRCCGKVIGRLRA